MKSFIVFLVLFFVSCSSTEAISEKGFASSVNCFVSSEEMEDWSTQTNNKYLKNSAYEVIYDNKNIQPFMVSYKLKYSKDTHVLDRKNDYDSRFLQDPRVDKSASNNDYKKSGFDKGHLAPAKDFSFSVEAAESTFLFSNISPQYATFNRNGAWKKLEDRARKISQESKGPIQILSGPIFTKYKKIKNSPKGPTIPDYFFKIIIKFDDEKCTYSEFVLKNSNLSGDYCKDRVSNDLIPGFINFHLKKANAEELNICN